VLALPGVLSLLCRQRGGLARLALALLLAMAASAAQADVAGSVVSLNGTVVARAPDGTQRIIAQKSDVFEGELLATASESYARLRFKDGGEITLRPNTQLRIETYKYKQEKAEEDNIFLNLLKGGLRAITGSVAKRNPRAYRMDALTATIGIRGTHYGALICQNDCGGLTRPDGSPLPNGLHLDVADGSILVSNDAGQQILNVNTFGFVKDRISLPQLLPRELGIRIPILDQQAPTGPGGPGATPGIQQECII
jgi:hypothetical protein